ncbi:uncharacterized protein LOC116166939 isoform X2 [Photinus pyralis]|uniref:uncharacterized protein LOC116166939 isoform X2 n=1 Tax=Photinus pyralis TaxID=7054 RepID=UPI0012670ECA|nr:uncharacterized protein LOC116166939 isoform X2 [Photinus pyralis]
MMMMDVGMYGHGHHNQYGSTYNPSEANFFGYQGESYPQGHTSEHQLSHYATSYYYEDSSYLCGNSSESPPPQQDINYYHPSHHQPIPHDNPIINTESGLSYTNLDYANSGACSNSGYLNSNQNIYPSDAGYQRTQSEVMARHHDNIIDGRQSHSYYDTKYHHLDNDSYSQLVLQNTSCAEYQQLQYKEEPTATQELDRTHPSLHSISQLSTVPRHTPAIPTYKWMQVKRNVPKPHDFCRYRTISEYISIEIPKMTTIRVLFIFAAIAASSANLQCEHARPNIPSDWIDMVKPCVQKVRAQIQTELEASIQYLAMAAHFSRDTVNRPGFAKFFFQAASEERQHALKLISYLLMRGELASGVNKLIKKTIIPPVVSWASGVDALKDALRLEAKVTKYIRGVISECEHPEEKEGQGFNDYHLVDYLNADFLEEQYKGQRDLAGMISNLEKMMNEHPALGEFMFDKKLLD